MHSTELTNPQLTKNIQSILKAICFILPMISLAASGNAKKPSQPSLSFDASTFAEMTDASCTDGQYTETLPDLNVDVSAQISLIAKNKHPSVDQVKQSMMDILSQAYPFGAYLIDQSPGFDRKNDCAGEWANTEYSWLNRFGLAVHECGHAMNSYFGSRNTYYISDDYSIPEMRNDFFPRSELTQDAYHAMIPDAAANATYFDVGALTSDQGIQTMYDEWSQYIHSVAMDYALYQYPEAKRDFYVKYMLNFAWAAQRYLKWAKEKHPQDYAAMLADRDLREATLVLWGQTWAYYDALINNTDWQPSAGEEEYMDAIREPALQAMLNEVRIAHGCEGKSD